MPVLVDGELILYGFVGDSFFGSGFTSNQVIDALAELGRATDVNVRINSAGGIANEGIAIFNSLKAHRGRVTVFVDAIAASAASVIAMAGKEVIMRTGATMMIHDPTGMTFGDASDHKKSVAFLNTLGDAIADIYAEKTGMSAKDARAIMKDEVWLSADEAIEQGFADSLDEEPAIEATAFDYRVYMKAPESLKTLAVNHAWSFDRSKHVKKRAKLSADPKEKSMTDKPTGSAEENAAAIAAATAEATKNTRERIKAIVTHAEAKGRESLAQHFAYETDDSVEKVVKALAAAPKAAEVTERKPSDEDYLKQKKEDGALGLGSLAAAGDGNKGSLKIDIVANARKRLGVAA